MQFGNWLPFYRPYSFASPSFDWLCYYRWYL